MIRFVVYIFLVLIVGVLSGDQDHPEVKLEQGALRGKYRQTLKGRKIISFTSIPYAQPPVGRLRFKPAVAFDTWDGVLDATKVAPICPQLDIVFYDGNVKGQEDCLYLNVYTPQLETTKGLLLPVMFYIHGGGLFCGSGNSDVYGPDILLDKDVVLVTFNYRLGALGFLSTEDELLPGNNGFKDQNLALKWVKKNIAHFGGDPEKITVFGQSAGGLSTHYHMVSPLSRELMSRAIIQSGTATTMWSIAPRGQALSHAKRLAGFLNCPNESKQEMIDCLSKIDALDIVAQDKKFAVFRFEPAINFKPVIEPNIEGAFITEDPVDTIISGKSAHVPLMIGVTTEEGAIRSAGIYNDSHQIEELNKDFNRLMPIIFMYDDNPRKNEITTKIRKYYFDDKDLDDSTKDRLTDLFSDAWFLYPHATTVQLHTKYTNHPVYSYIFGVEGSFSFAKILGDPEHDYGVCHCDELFSLFSMEVFPDYKPNESEKKCIDIMTNMWAAFALTGNPTPATDSLIKTKWVPTQNDVLSYYFLRSVDDIRMTQDTYKERVDFWKDLSYDSRSSRINDAL